MNRVVRILFRVVVVVLVLCGIAWAGLAIRQNAIYGEVLSEDDRTATVDVGDKFSISVQDYKFAGITWTSEVAPVTSVRFVEHRIGNTAIGRIIDFGTEETIGSPRGSLNYIYEAVEPGAVTITMSRCNAHCIEPAPTEEHTTVIWTITVR